MAKVHLLKKFNARIYKFLNEAIEQNDHTVLAVHGEFEYPSNETTDLIRAFVSKDEIGVILSDTGQILDVFAGTDNVARRARSMDLPK